MSRFENIEDCYEFVENPKEKTDEGAVKILFGTFTGLIYKYNNFKFEKPETKEEAESPRMKYEFDILYIPEELVGVNYSDEEKESFDHLLAEILLHIIMKQMEKSERVKYDNTDREGDIDESFERRVVYEFDNPVSEE